MSAFIVEDLTISRFLNFLQLNPHRFNWVYDMVKEKLNLDINEDEDLQILGQRLLEMNYEAVNQRYKANDKPGKFTLTGPSMINPFQAIKSLHCFLYQCLEGSVPESNLYKAMREIEISMAESIVRQHEQYQNAEWR